MIADTFANYEKVSERVKDKKIFSNVYTVNIKDTLLPQKSKISNIKKLYYVLRPKKMIKKYLGKIENYDEMYCWNYDVFTANIRSYFSFIKKPIKIFLFDEGYVSYFPLNEVIPKKGFIKLIEKRNKLFNISNVVRDNVNGLIVFEPDLVFKKPQFPVYKIDRNRNKKEIVNLVNYIFEVGDVSKNYDRKYIIFEEAMLANDPSVKDEELYDKIIKKVGSDNVIIKLHPRTNEDRFTKKGIKTLGSDGIPWEAITFASDFGDKVFITIGSNTVPNYKMFNGDDMMGIMLFKFVKTNLICMEERYKSFWNKFAAEENKRGIHFPKTEEEFFNLLDEIEKGKFN